MASYKTLNDAELAVKIRDSDEAAFQTLYYRYYDSIFRFVFYRIRSKEEARDFVQEVFTRVWIKRDVLDPKRSVKAYIYRIANNMVIDHIRKSASRKLHRRRMSKHDLTTEGGYDERISIRDAINDLPDKLRLVFTMSRYQGLKYSEIAEACQVSIKTVESRMSRALQILRKTLSD